jgi:hypothetical protein
MAVWKFDANKPREFVGRRIGLLDVRAQFFVGLVLAPVLRPQGIEDIAGIPTGTAFGTETGAIQTGGCFVKD